MKPARLARIAAGLGIVAVGVWLVLDPLVVASLLGRPHETSTQMINLRASWGGTIIGLGAFVAWLPALRPWWRTLLGLLSLAMAGIGVARAAGFVLDGHPDGLQWVWLVAEVVIVVVCALGLRMLARRTPNTTSDSR